MAITTTNNNTNWIAGLTDPGIKDDVANLTASGTLAFSGALQILTDVAASIATNATKAVTTAEFNDLQTIAANLNNGIATSDYVVSIFTQLADGSPANVSWTGGATASTPLGNLHVGTTTTQLNELIGKWFLGTDLPNATGEGATSSQLIHPTYQAFTQPLYGSAGVPVVTDIVQGDVGDCELCAGMIELVANHPSQVELMFVNDGNGTYGVRFYVGGKSMWVTVDDQLPVYGGTLLYNDGTGLWADLLEKAYAQLSSTGLIDQPAANSYSNISGDYAFEVMQNLTNAPNVQYYYSVDKNWNGFKDLFINAIAVKDDVILESNGNTYDSSGNQKLISDHAFAVVGYDSATGDFIVRNPWGSVSATQGYETQFEVSMADIAGVTGDIVIDSSSNPNIVVSTLGQVTTFGQSASFGEFIPTGQYVAEGSTAPVTTLFSVVDLAGLPITQYMFQAIGTGTVQLNGATNLASATQQAQGQIVVAAADLSKLTFAAGSTVGSTDLLVSAYDGVSWSTATDISLTITALPGVVTPNLNTVVAPAANLSIAGLFSVSGSSGAGNVYYDFTLESDVGTINLNGAKNLLTRASAGQVEVSASDLSDLTYTAPATAPSASSDQAYLDVTVYNGSTALSNTIQIPIMLGTSVAAAIQSYNASEISTWIAVADKATNVFGNLDMLQTMLSVADVGWISLTDSTVQNETLSQTQFTNDQGVLSILNGNYTLTVTGETAAGASAAITQAHVVSVAVADSAANVTGNLNALQSLAAAGHLTSITLTDAGTPDLTVSATQLAQDMAAVGDILGSYALTVTGETAAGASALVTQAHVVSVDVSDSAANVAANLNALQSLAAAGHLTSITLTDGGTPNLTVSATQLAQDIAAVGDIAGSYALTVTGVAAPIANFLANEDPARSQGGANYKMDVAGVSTQSGVNSVVGFQTATPPSGAKNAVVLAGSESQYTLSVSSTGTLTLTADATTADATAGQTVHVGNASYVVFDGAATTNGAYQQMMIIAANAGDATVATLYQSTFGRLPDLPGLEAWENQLDSGAMTLAQIAQAFAGSGEFTTRYGAVAGLGDLQYVTDMYSNVLGRSPDQGGLTAWTSYLTGLEAASGNTATGNLSARATVLLDFCASAEEVTNSSSWVTTVGSAQASHAASAIPTDLAQMVVDLVGVAPVSAVHLAG